MPFDPPGLLKCWGSFIFIVENSRPVKCGLQQFGNLSFECRSTISFPGRICPLHYSITITPSIDNVKHFGSLCPLIHILSLSTDHLLD